MSATDEYLRNNAAYAAQFAGPLPHKDAVRGFVFDVATGKLNEVA